MSANDAVAVIAGVNASTGLAGRIALAVLGPVVAAVIWSIGIAPKARRRWAVRVVVPGG